MTYPTRNLVYGLCFMAAVMVAGVIGYLMAGWDWSDAVYMVVISIFTVGYGEVRPINEEGLRGFTMLLIVLGCFSVIFVSGALVQFLMEGQIRRALGDRRMSAELKKLNKHAIICGYGRIGRMVAADLKAGQRPFIVVDKDPRRLEAAREADVLVATVRVTLAHGPAAKATRYVLMRCVWAKRWVTRAPAVSAPISAPFASARQAVGVVSDSRTFALRSGWSKHGKSRLASDGTSNVYR